MNPPRLSSAGLKRASPSGPLSPDPKRQAVAVACGGGGYAPSWPSPDSSLGTLIAQRLSPGPVGRGPIKGWIPPACWVVVAWFLFGTGGARKGHRRVPPRMVDPSIRASDQASAARFAAKGRWLMPGLRHSVLKDLREFKQLNHSTVNVARTYETVPMHQLKTLKRTGHEDLIETFGVARLHIQGRERQADVWDAIECLNASKREVPLKGLGISVNSRHHCKAVENSKYPKLLNNVLRYFFPSGPVPKHVMLQSLHIVLPEMTYERFQVNLERLTRLEKVVVIIGNVSDSGASLSLPDTLTLKELRVNQLMSIRGSAPFSLNHLALDGWTKLDMLNDALGLLLPRLGRYGRLELSNVLPVLDDDLGEAMGWNAPLTSSVISLQCLTQPLHSLTLNQVEGSIILPDQSLDYLMLSEKQTCYHTVAFSDAPLPPSVLASEVLASDIGVRVQIESKYPNGPVNTWTAINEWRPSSPLTVPRRRGDPWGAFERVGMIFHETEGIVTGENGDW